MKIERISPFTIEFNRNETKNINLQTQSENGTFCRFGDFSGMAVMMPAIVNIPLNEWKKKKMFAFNWVRRYVYGKW